MIVNPDRNAIVYITNVKQGGYPILAAFDMDADFDGDRVHKATSIHTQIDVQTLLEQLSEKATIYVQNKNELETVGATNNLRGLSANIKFIDEIVPRSETTVNKKFSMRDTVEETKDLIALHNLTEEKLQKALDLGGFPMPSIAVTKSDIPHTNFGDITLVFGRETIDPKASRKNTVYSADAWTPTFPQIEYEINDKVGNAAYKRLRGLESRIDEHFRRDIGRVEYGMSDTLNRYGGEEGFIQYALDNYGMKAAYLEEQGQHISPQTKQEKTGVEVSPEMEDKYAKIMDVLGIYDPSEIGNLVLKDVREQHGAELEEVYPGITKTAFRLGNVLSRIRDWLSGNSGTEYKTVTDVSETRKSIDAVLV